MGERERRGDCHHSLAQTNTRATCQRAFSRMQEASLDGEETEEMEEEGGAPAEEGGIGCRGYKSNKEGKKGDRQKRKQKTYMI